MSRAAWLVFAAALAVPPSTAHGQVTIRTAALFESYSFGEGVLIDNISEFTVPLVATVRLSRRSTVTLSGGFTAVNFGSADTGELADQSVSGPLDTEVRVAYDVVPGRLVALATGAIPSGTKTVAFEELSILGALSSDIIGFSAANLGTGGSVGGGFAGALPAGRFALGYGATYRQSMRYAPVAGSADQLTPGSEVRVRAGLEGPLARRTYVRFAGVYAARAKDAINGEPRNGIGNRVIGYLAVNQGLGGAELTLYGFDVFRGDPQIEPTATGAAVFPRGNLLAFGARAEFGSRTVIAPRVEYRVSATARDTLDTTLRRAGSTLRVGADVHMPLGTRTTLVFQASGLTGSVVQAGENVGLGGFRGGVNLEFRP